MVLQAVSVNVEAGNGYTIFGAIVEVIAVHVSSWEAVLLEILDDHVVAVSNRTSSSLEVFPSGAIQTPNISEAVENERYSKETLVPVVSCA